MCAAFGLPVGLNFISSAPADVAAVCNLVHSMLQQRQRVLEQRAQLDDHVQVGSSTVAKSPQHHWGSLGQRQQSAFAAVAALVICEASAQRHSAADPIPSSGSPSCSVWHSCCRVPVGLQCSAICVQRMQTEVALCGQTRDRLQGQLHARERELAQVQNKASAGCKSLQLT